MTEQLAQTLPRLPQMGSESVDAWTLAKKRANDYLKLHRLPDAEREHLLSRITLKLAHANVYTEQELIQLFISTAQEELALLQTNSGDASCCNCKKTAAPHAPQDDMPPHKAELRTKTGPRFERSSIRVAPLKAISLLPSRSRQRPARHPH